LSLHCTASPAEAGTSRCRLGIFPHTTAGSVRPFSPMIRNSVVALSPEHSRPFIGGLAIPGGKTSKVTPGLERKLKSSGYPYGSH
jgi:hypothetical protein